MHMASRVRLARSTKGFSLGKPKVREEVLETEGLQDFFELPGELGKVLGPRLCGAAAEKCGAGAKRCGAGAPAPAINAFRFQSARSAGFTFCS